MQHFYSASAVLLLAAMVAPQMQARTRNVLPDSLEGRRTIAEARTGVSPIVPSREEGDAGRQLPVVKLSEQKAPPAKVRKEAPTGDLPTIRGHVYYSEDFDKRPKGMYTFTPDGNNFTLISGDKPIGDASYGSVWLDDKFYATYVSGGADGKPKGVMLAYDTDTWDMVSDTPLQITSVGTAMVEDNGTVYGIFYDSNASKWVFGTMDMSVESAYAVTPIGAVNVQVNSMAINKNGVIYMISQAGDLYTVNKSTGALTKIGATGVVPYYTSSACIDKRTGRMFWNVCPTDNHGYMYEVDTTTGAATLLCQLEYGDEIIGMDIAFEADDLAPAAPEQLTATFTEGSLSGNVQFVCPTTTYNGQAASGALNYTISADRTVVAQGTSAYGEAVDAAVTLPKAGQVKISVTVANSVGTSPVARTVIFAGTDTPAAPEQVTATYADGQFNISWTPVTTTVNGGYMDLSQLKYIVTRMPDATVVADGISATTYTDPVDASAGRVKYSYKVAATCGGKTGGATESEGIFVGEIAAPWSESFDDAESLDIFTILDANDDGITWIHDTDDNDNGIVKVNYNTSLDTDDWLITPGIHLAGGKTYRMSFDAMAGSNSYPERVEAFAGVAPTVAAMTTRIVSPTDITSKEARNCGGDFTAPTDGIYYFGIHGISTRDQLRLIVDNIAVSAPISGTMPSTVTDLTATAGAYGALTATIAGNAPSVNRSGDPLDEPSSVIIRKGEQTLTTITDLAAGAPFSFVDNNCTEGFNTYTVSAANSNGEGSASEISVYVGINIPMPVTDLEVVETGIDTGVAHISWTAPATDINGNAMRPQDITYRVVDASSGSTLAYDLTDTQYDYVLGDNSQRFLTVAVYAISSKGESAYTLAPMIAIGVPYALTWKESFDYGHIRSILGIEHIRGEKTWGVTASGNLLADDADGTMGFAFHQGEDVDDSSIIYTGKIDLRNASNPRMSLFTYNIPDDGSNPQDDINELELLVRKHGDKQWTILSRGTVNELCGGQKGWNLIGAQLNSYCGEVIEVGVKAITKMFQYTYIDMLKVAEELPHNLAVTSIEAPSRKKHGETFDVTVTVENIGSQNADNFTVALYRNDNPTPAATVDASLGASQRRTFKFENRLSFDDENGASFHAVVEYPADQAISDNTSESVYVRRITSTRSRPTDLDVVGNNDGSHSLTWNAPYNNKGYELIEDDLESYESWATDGVGDWKFVDADGQPIGGFNGVTFPGIPAGSCQSFFVLDSSDLDDSFSANSGNKCFASIYRSDEGKCDDWVISPELSGYSQPIDLKATSFHPQARESLEFYYSTTGREISDFIKVRGFNNISPYWGTFSFDVPEGAKYFAVRCITEYGYMLRLDDFAYEAKPESPIGYNIYRDDVKLNDEPVADTSFVDTTPIDTPEATYRVTAVYRTDESEPCEKVSITTSVGGPTFEVAVRTIPGAIVIEGAEGLAVRVADTAGLTLFSGIAEPTMRISTVPGIYIVTVADKTFKVRAH